MTTDSALYSPDARAVCRNFDELADSVLVTIPEASAVPKRSRSSLYLAFGNGTLPRIKVGDLRKVIRG